MSIPATAFEAEYETVWDWQTGAVGEDAPIASVPEQDLLALLEGGGSPSPSSRKYFVYHLHSDLSMLDSCTRFEQYIDLADHQGMTAIASTEHGKPLGWVAKKLLCEEKGLKFVHGVEIYLTEQLEPKTRDNYHTVLLAKNAEGLRELNRLIKTSCDEQHFYYTNRISFEEFLSVSDNIIKTSACLASPLNKLEDSHPMYMRLARHYDYLEVQPHVCEEQAEYNRRLWKLSQTIGKPIVAGTDTHNASEYKAQCRKILMKRKKKSYGNEDQFDLTWKTYDGLVEAFRRQGALPEEVFMQAIENTNVIESSCEEIPLDRSIKYPILYGSREEDERVFERMVEEKFSEKVASGVIPGHQAAAFTSAITEEMAVFKELGMTGFMLSMAELLGWCKQQGMAIGTARGSVGGSRIAYVTDIIDLNPETWHTAFSRFCNRDRKEIGDIDIDVVESDRPAIFRHIIDRFGEAHTARVGAFTTIAELGAIDDIGGALRIMWEEMHLQDDTVSSEDNPWSLKKIDRIKKEYSSAPADTRQKYPELFYYFDGLLGTTVSQSVHPAGIVISPLDLAEEYGVFDKEGEQCLLINMDELHEVGAAKYDLTK